MVDLAERLRDLATGFLGNYSFNVGFTGDLVADMLLGYYSGVGIFQPAAFSVPGAAGNPREFCRIGWPASLGQEPGVPGASGRNR